MLRIIASISLFIVLFYQSGYSSNTDEIKNTIIPKPNYFKVSDGYFTINKNTVISVDVNDSDLKAIASQLADEIYSVTKIQLKIVRQKELKSNFIKLSLTGNLDSLGNEGYKLNADKNAVKVSSKSSQGIFYGIQSLIQLVRKHSENKILAVEIIDKPQFAWRGMMLDVGRYYYSPEFIKKMLDQMAVYKMNKFHWHLTDDSGWRIEIKKYPELTQKGAWRKESQFGIGLDNNWVNKNAHGGFYTQEEIKEVIRYAQSKYIEIIPEIEMPGHAMAALSVFPNLSCTGGPFEVPGTWGIKLDAFCAGNEQTFSFLEDVLSEVVELFPSKMIHIGGDECKKDRWKACPKCQFRIKKEGLKDEHELQSYFIKRMEKFLNAKGRNIIGWDEILEGGLAPNAMVMSWRGTKGGVEAIKQGHKVIMSPNTFFYFDYYQGLPDLEPPYGRTRVLPIEKVYSYTPSVDGLTPAEAKLIEGVQANVWTELLHTRESVEYMIFPRITAVAEVGWTQPSLKKWEDFARRTENEFNYYQTKGITYSESIYHVELKTSDINKSESSALLTLQTPSYTTHIRYTLDGSEPVSTSPVYEKPFRVKYPVNLNMATFKDGKKVGKTITKSIAVFK